MHSYQNGNVKKAIDELLSIRGMGIPPEGVLNIEGADPFYASPLKLGETLAAVLAARGLSASDLWELRSGESQNIQVNVRRAAAVAQLGSSATEVRTSDGHYQPILATAEVQKMIDTTQCWPSADGRWLLPHTNLPHMVERVMNVLNCEYSVGEIQRAIRSRNAAELEESIYAGKGTAGMVRTPEEWLEHPQGIYLSGQPVVEIDKLKDGPPEPIPPGISPLDGVRVIDMTRIIAGPTAGLAMAEHGADVMIVTAKHLPQVPAFIRDTSHGKRSCYLDLSSPQDFETLDGLIGTADVFLDGYRPGTLAARGISTDKLLQSRPGLIHTTINCFGSGGPWASRAGWDQIAQAVTGMCHVHGYGWTGGHPKLAPVFICDFLAGFLASFGTMIALRRRATEGGSYRVRTSLCQAAMLLLRQGTIEGFHDAAGILTNEESLRWRVEVNNTPYGDLRLLGPVIEMSKTPPLWYSKPTNFGSDEPLWKPRVGQWSR